VLSIVHKEKEIIKTLNVFASRNGPNLAHKCPCVESHPPISEGSYCLRLYCLRLLAIMNWSCICTDAVYFIVLVLLCVNNCSA
jgi:hypothetical protein